MKKAGRTTQDPKTGGKPKPKLLQPQPVKQALEHHWRRKRDHEEDLIAGLLHKAMTKILRVKT